MKYCILIFIFFVSLDASSQKSHAEILKMTTEIRIIDGLYLDIPNFEKTEIDEITGQKLFRKFYGTDNLFPHDTKYYISGKITRHPDFDILFLYAEKNTTDTLKSFDLLLLTTRKDGTQISMMVGASDHHYIRDNKMQFSKTRSYLYTGYKIKQQNEISIFNKKFEMEYRINDFGVFVSYPKS